MNQSLKKRDFARARSFFKRKDIGMKRYFMAFIGVVFIGLSVAVLNLSGFGVDPFSCMNMSVSAHLPFSFGVWQIFVNAVILTLLVIHVIKEKRKIRCGIWIWNIMEYDRGRLTCRFFYNKVSLYFFKILKILELESYFSVVAILGYLSGMFHLYDTGTRECTI